MNSIVELPFPVSKQHASPSPDIIREEVKKFHATSESYKNWNMGYRRKTSHTEYIISSITPTCSESNTEFSDYEEDFQNPPPSCRWSQSLLYLLNDAEGFSLFQQFLQQEGQDTRCLAFWLACRSLKSWDPDDQDPLVKLINVLRDKKIKSISTICTKTKEEINQDLSFSNEVDTILDTAQSQVEAYLMKTAYPSFLRSDLYIKHLLNNNRKQFARQDQYSIEKECIVSQEAVDIRPTVHENSELQNNTSSNDILLTNVDKEYSQLQTELSLQREKTASVTESKPQAGDLSSSFVSASSQDGLQKLSSDYHLDNSSALRYRIVDLSAPLLPISAQRGDLQNLSSDDCLDNRRTRKDRKAFYPMYNRIKSKHRNKLSKNNTIWSKNEHSACESKPKDGTSISFLPLLIKKLNKILDEQTEKERMFPKIRLDEDPSRFNRPQRFCGFPGLPGIPSSLNQSLVLPNKYRYLGEKFQWMDKVINTLNNRKLKVSFEKGQNKKHKKVWNSHLGQIKGAFPDIFSVLYIKTSSDPQRDTSYTLVINPNISGNIADTKSYIGEKPKCATAPWIILNRKAIYHPELVNIVKMYHRVFFAHETAKLIKNPISAQDERYAVMLERLLKMAHILWPCFFPEYKAPALVDAVGNNPQQSLNFRITQELKKEHIQHIAEKFWALFFSITD